jgi:hypothetical protein
MKKTPNGRGGGLVIYVTSHGFGHLNRTAAVVNRVPLDVPVTIKSHSNLFKDWPDRLTRPAGLVAYVSDVGAVNPPGDSAATDGPRTLELASRCHAEAMARLDDEVARLREQGAAAVLCDAPAVPLVAARRAGVPGFLMSNFTWADIYAPHARAVGTAQATRLVAELRAAYRQAVATFRMEPAMSMSWLSTLINVGMVVKPGRDRRAQLCRLTGLERKDKLVYLYLGRYGQSDLDWSRLERFSARGIHFLSYHPVSAGRLDNLHVIPAADWPGSDLIASSDAILGKAGYGTICEAMACGTPMIYPPRRGFAEFRSLDRALRAWAGGFPVSARDFRALKLEQRLERAFQLDPGPPPFPADGADRIVEHVLPLCRPLRGQRASVVGS